MFRYFKEGDALDTPVTRVLDENVQVYLDKKLENGEPKYKEVSFTDWWDGLASDTRREWTSEDGTVTDPEYGVLDQASGEPVPQE